MGQRSRGSRGDEASDPFVGLARADRRDRARSKAREGMQVSGASVKVLARAAAERARKAAVAAHEREMRDRARRGER
ncbi:MAG TPA: hypothetical protein VG370_06640 [Chloroflexota bacterium]|nr:hypothetical protein [Chloroflexota bacterium]